MGPTTNSMRSQFLLTVAPPLLLTGILYMLQHTSPDVVPREISHILAPEDEAQCPVDLGLKNACKLVRDKCADFDGDGLLPYLRIYACTSTPLRPLLLIGMIVWLLVLFASMATAASDFLAVHLAYVVQTLGISQNLAGVTLFAFGNGCTDLFATFAAMGANNGSLAISELFGAAAFITTVVLGLIASFQTFSVNPRAFVGDVVWFFIAASLLVAFLADGQLTIGECLGIIGLYAAFALFAVLRPREHDRSRRIIDMSSPNENFQDNNEPEDVSNAVSDEDESREQMSAYNERLLNTPIQPPAQEAILGLNYNTFRPPLGEYLSAPQEIVDDDLDAQELEDLGLPPDVGSTPIPPQHPPTSNAISNDSIWKNFPPLCSWQEQSKAERVLTTFCLPLLLPIGLTIPRQKEPAHLDLPVPLSDELRDEGDTLSRIWWTWRASYMLNRLKLLLVPQRSQILRNLLWCLQLILALQLFSTVVVSQSMESAAWPTFITSSFISLLASLLAINYILSAPPSANAASTRGVLVSSIAFVASLTWIYLTATSAVTLLMTLATIFKLPPALLGATIFAVGQSSNDLVANVAVARRGMPVLAASATFGGPMMNMFMGIGGGGLVQVLKSKANGGPGIYTFHAAAGLFVSASNLLVGLAITLAYAFWRSWQLDRRLGVVLISTWVIFTAVNVGLGLAR